MQRQNRS